MLRSIALRLVVLASLFGASAAVAADRPLNQLSAEEVADGWVRLFDGETFFGWKPNSDVNWKITEGVIHGDTGEPGLLCTNTVFSDYELRCDFRLEAKGNSGVFLRTLFQPKEVTKDCYELNMCDSHPAFPTGSLVGIVKPQKTIVGEGKWFKYRVVVVGKQIDVWLDGEQILSYTDNRPEARFRGLIGLQKNAGKAEYRNIFLKPLGAKPLFNGKDLSGWHVVPGSKSKFTVEEGAIHVVDGRGFLESDATFADFLLQFDARTNGKHLNSGVFFRAMAGTEKDPSNGYEAQIHNAWKDDDRTKPVDFGTGAIYRRIAARRVVSNDFEWTTMTLAATGPHIAVWVNGEHVTDWTDTRKPNENPREGLRTKAGHLSLQGHDPTTDLLFRNLRAAELPAVK
ncbi:MAG: DUF1080 domain-containing protein [Planctomycetota bacterium]|nr:DUF1080 domain-containing protein [Planctomycetota bacterium]